MRSSAEWHIYSSKDDVYLDGGPAHPSAAGLPDGYYYVQVTEPDGTQLGTSVTSGNDTPVHVTNGEFDSCYRLSAILIKTSDGSPGYDATSNPGAEYKVWVSNDASFTNSSTKTDNFKVNEETSGPPPQATLNVRKFYDANADGSRDNGEVFITGWRVRIQDDIDYIRFTPGLDHRRPGRLHGDRVPADRGQLAPHDDEPGRRDPEQRRQQDGGVRQRLPRRRWRADPRLLVQQERPGARRRGRPGDAPLP